MTDTDRRWTQEERLASLKHRLASETARRAPDLTDLTDLALARYAFQWQGTERGSAAQVELTRREAAARRESADPYGGTIPSIVRVRETIRHGDVVSRLTVGGSTLADAVASSLGVSPYNHAGAPHIAGGDLQARIVADLTATGHAEFGWADYDVVA